jgi:hypothetical protein
MSDKKYYVNFANGLAPSSPSEHYFDLFLSSTFDLCVDAAELLPRVAYIVVFPDS